MNQQNTLIEKKQVETEKIHPQGILHASDNMSMHYNHLYHIPCLWLISQ